MKLSPSIMLGLVLTACGDDSGLGDTGSTGSSTGATADGSGSEGVDGGSTTEGDPTDPTPILEREPMLTHACEEVRPMTSLEGDAFGRLDALVTLGSERFVLRSAETLALAGIALDGTIGGEVVLEANEFTFRNPTAVAVDAGIAAVWTYAESALRYAVVDETLATVVAPKEIPGITSESVMAAAMVPSTSGGVALIYGESNGAGDTSLRFVSLDADGEPTAAPVDVAEVGPTYGWAWASAAATPDGGLAVAYDAGGTEGSEVFFVVLDGDGSQRLAPQRISRAAEGGWWSDLGSAPRPRVLPVGDRYWVTFTEGWSADDPAQMEGHVVVRLAIVDAEGHSESHLLQAPVQGRNNLWPSFVELDGRVGLLWTSGTIIWVCGGCITDNDLHFVLLDPEAVVPASDVVTQLHQMNGITAPLGAFVGSDLLTASSLDFHALTRPATGALRCEAAG